MKKISIRFYRRVAFLLSLIGFYLFVHFIFDYEKMTIKPISLFDISILFALWIYVAYRSVGEFFLGNNKYEYIDFILIIIYLFYTISLNLFVVGEYGRSHFNRNIPLSIVALFIIIRYFKYKRKTKNV